MNQQQIIEAEFSNLSPCYFNSAYFGPSPLRTQQAGQEAIARGGNPHNFPYQNWRPIPDQIRNKIGELLNVSAEQISHHCSVSEVTSYLSMGFK